MKIFANYQISEKEIIDSGKNPAEIIKQLETFESGLPFVKLHSAATINHGIEPLYSFNKDNLLKEYNEALESHSISMFIPASGAASRMFKILFNFVNSKFPRGFNYLKSASRKEPVAAYILKIWENLNRFAFYDELKTKYEKEGDRLLCNKDYFRVIAFLIEVHGLNLANLPKALIPFHKYNDGERTAFAEHLYECAEYITNNNKLNAHFTVLPAHIKLFEEAVELLKPEFKKRGIELNISFSVQKPHTDTIALNYFDRKAFRMENGEVLFRPGGHGALLENLNDLDSDIVVIKNVDNTSPDHHKPIVIEHKKYLIGILQEYRKNVFGYLELLSNGNVEETKLNEIQKFANSVLNIDFHDYYDELNTDEKQSYLFNMLNRPIRVCGMIKNQGDPGGGPYWIVEKDGRKSLQIIEASQINVDDPFQARILENATHFNPVDLVCGIKDFRGNKFDLPEYRNSEMAFISKKYQAGKQLYALELPGLWNGGMANWITIFVEVPKETFTPVKEIIDLINDYHAY